jgi:hypothetical protein
MKCHCQATTPRERTHSLNPPFARAGARFRHGYARGHPSLDGDVQRGATRGRRTAAGTAACPYKPCEQADSGETQARPAESTHESQEALMLARLEFGGSVSCPGVGVVHTCGVVRECVQVCRCPSDRRGDQGRRAARKTSHHGYRSTRVAIPKIARRPTQPLMPPRLLPMR